MKTLYFLIFILSFGSFRSVIFAQTTCEYDFPNNYDNQENLCDLIDCNNCDDIILNNLNDKNGNSVLTFDQDINITSLTLNYKAGNSPLEIIIPDSVTVNITGDLDFNLSSDPQEKFLTVDGELIVGGNIDLDDINMEIDGTGTIDAGSITGGGNTTCSTSSGGTGTCPDFNVPPGNCSPAGSDFCNDPALPITLLFFNASAVDSQVELSWASSSEENFDFFAIERSANAKEYEVIGTVPGHGWSDRIINYSFSDNNPLKGRAYYRLKAVDFDDTFEYFQTIMVNSENTNNSVRISSNPVGENLLQFQLNFVPTKEMSVEITDVSGNRVFSGTFEPGLSKYIVDKQFERGVYILKVSTGDKIYTSRFLKN